jgi:hypothetical protein
LNVILPTITHKQMKQTKQKLENDPPDKLDIAIAIAIQSV